MFSFVILRASSLRKLCCVRISTLAQSKSFPGSFYVGNWKPPSRKFVYICEWRLNVSGVTLPYCERLPLFWGFSL